MNREQVADKERGEEKGKSPYNPLKEKEGQKEISAVPEPVPVHHAGAHVRAQEDRAPSRPPIGTGTGTVGFRQDFGTGTGSVEIRPGVTFRLESFHILDGRREDGTRNDPVSVALVALRLPKIATYPDGRSYNNARLMRWYLKQIGEDAFRELLHQQWRENAVDGDPHSRAAAFMAKLYAVRDELKGVGA